jgi:phage shock protein PspC (stress-responsive transcriptional regulator)
MSDQTPTPEPEEPPKTEPTEPLGARAAGGDVPPPPPPADGPRKLTRSSSDKLIGGVAGGLGRYFGVDPILFRIAFVVLTFAGGVGALGYIGLLAFVPADDGSEVFGSRRWPRLLAAVALGIVVCIVIGSGGFFAPVLLPIAFLILVGAMIWRAGGGATGDRDPARMVLRAAIAFVIGVAALACFAAVFFVAALGGGTALAALAVIAGVTLVATAFVGGARWLIIPALILVLPLAIVAAADIDMKGGVGERQYRPTSLADMRDGYRLGMGQLVVDLRDVDLPPGRTDVKLDLGIGGAVVRVPDDACVTADVNIGAGAASVLNRINDGVDVAFASDHAPDGDAPQVQVNADIGVGALDVRRGDDGPDWNWDHHHGDPVEPVCP